jgi:hypothetical protein
MLHALESKQTDKSHVNVICTEIETKERAWMNVYENVTCTEIETNR